MSEGVDVRPVDRVAGAGPSGPLRRSRSGSRDDHQSIGEVLAELRGEFPDITISKIRFLESQGLIDPERTRRATASSATATSPGSGGSSSSRRTTSCR